MFYVEVIGYIGCLFLFMSFIPQTYKLIYHGPIETISPLFLSFILCASLFLGIYAFYINAYPILVANISVFLNNSIILILYLYKKKYPSNINHENRDGILV